METLAVQVVRLDLSQEIISALREELTGGGMSTGTVFIGGVSAKPELLYLVWHKTGEVPVSIALRDPRRDVTRARHAAREFLVKWHECRA